MPVLKNPPHGSIRARRPRVVGRWLGWGIRVSAIFQIFALTAGGNVLKRWGGKLSRWGKYPRGICPKGNVHAGGMSCTLISTQQCTTDTKLGRLRYRIIPFIDRISPFLVDSPDIMADDPQCKRYSTLSVKLQINNSLVETRYIRVDCSQTRWWQQKNVC